jgi:TDG/mug DNA glycosylase family protein
MERYKPTRQDLIEAINKKVPDVITPHLKVLFCGINPGLYTAAVGYHFARPGNRFWPALYEGGFTPRLLYPEENAELLEYGYGITNLVEKPTLQAGELTKDELIDGRVEFEKKIAIFKPNWVAILGLQAFRIAYDKKARLGKQDFLIGESKVWVMPNPSGLNAHFLPKDWARLFREFKKAVDEKCHDD